MTHLVYWHRHCNHERKRPALFFLHGLGFGICPYVGFLKYLVENLGGEQDIIAPEWPNISLGWMDNYCSDELPSSQEYADSIYIIAKRHTPSRKADFIGHSFGSAMINYVFAHHPSIINKRVYWDPIVFCNSFPSYAIFSYEHYLSHFSTLWREAKKRSDAPLLFCFREWFVKTDINTQQITKLLPTFWRRGQTAPARKCFQQKVRIFLAERDTLIIMHIREYLKTLKAARQLFCSTKIGSTEAFSFKRIRAVR